MLVTPALKDAIGTAFAFDFGTLALFGWMALTLRSFLRQFAREYGQRNKYGDASLEHLLQHS